MLRFLLALSRRYWLVPLIFAALALALWSEWSFAPAVPGAPDARDAVVSEATAIVLCLSAVALAVAAALWLKPRRRALKRWLLEPLRQWIGADDSRRPRP